MRIFSRFLMKLNQITATPVSMIRAKIIHTMSMGTDAYHAGLMRTVMAAGSLQVPSGIVWRTSSLYLPEGT